MEQNSSMPKEKGLDHTLNVLKEGYEFILNRRDKYETNVFETKLLGEKTICLTGKEAAKLFYDNEKFKRSGAAPKRVQKTLFGENGVQALDGEAHHHRKEMFMSLMTKSMLAEISELTKKYWTKYAAEWETKDKITLHEESKKILTHIACEWTGVPLEDSEVDMRAEQLGDMFEEAAAVGPGYWKGKKARSHGEEWMEEMIEKVRNGKMNPPEDRALYRFSFHRDLDGELLNQQVVAVELLNLLRPMVAISVYISFLAHALYENKEETEKLRSGDPDQLQRFIQEVRRFYPFFPFAGARVKQDFTWEGYLFEEDTLTLMDLYGTNHDPSVWAQPDEFQPERFKTWKGSPFDFIPQGGGEFDIGHRCAGEWLTLDILKESLNYLVNHMTYKLPDQDLSYSMSDIPSLPKSGVVMTDVKRKESGSRDAI
ncbi:cytochrome P450 [Bacillus sp. NTK071]|nr:cytochrome P450 [Bacillus sp. NTK071]MBN8209812.1 cytochrome P450 [Bacillus sp. NTK071]